MSKEEDILRELEEVRKRRKQVDDPKRLLTEGAINKYPLAKREPPFRLPWQRSRPNPEQPRERSQKRNVDDAEKIRKARRDERGDDEDKFDRRARETMEWKGGGNTPRGHGKFKESASSKEKDRTMDVDDATFGKSVREAISGDVEISSGNADNYYILTIDVFPQNAGRTNPERGKYRVKADEKVNVTQKTRPGCEFSHWELDGFNVNEKSVDVLMDKDRSVVAVFELHDQQQYGPQGFLDPNFERAYVLGETKFIEEDERPVIIVDTEPIHNVPVYMARWEKIKPYIEKIIKEKEQKYKKHLINIDNETDLTKKLDLIKKIIFEMNHDEIEEYIIPHMSNQGSTTSDRGLVKRVNSNEIFLVYLPENIFAGKKFRFSQWADGGGSSLRPAMASAEFARLVGQYIEFKIDVVHTRRPTLRSPYQSGTTGIKDSALGTLQQSWIRKRIGRDVKTGASSLKSKGSEQYIKDPYFLAAVNKGKRILNRYARAEYTHIFEPFKKDWKNRKEDLVKKEKKAAEARKILKKVIREKGKAGRIKQLGMTNQDLAYKAAALADEKSLDQAQLDAKMALEEYMKSRDEYFKDFRSDLEEKSLKLRKVLYDKASVIAVGISRRYKMPYGKQDIEGRVYIEQQIEIELKDYAEVVAERFVTQGRTWWFAMVRGIENVGRGTETFSAAGMNVLQSTVDLIFGPWTWTTAFVLLQFFFVFNFVGYNVTYLWIFPLIGGAFTFMLNFSDSFKPLDWVTHFASGAIIGYSSMLLLISLGALSWTFMTTVWFWIIWAIIGFLGIMQFYQTAGWKVVLQGGVIVLAFSYVALGPYSAYYQQALDQVKAPVEIAFRAVEGAVTDMWLLATNPTEFYARQQVVNVRPEKPIDFAKGVEVTLFDALPPSVPAGQEFAITAVLENEGSQKEPATSVSVMFGCKYYCNVPPVPEEIAQQQYVLCEKSSVYNLVTSGTYQQFYCAENCPSSASSPTTLGECIEQCVARGDPLTKTCITPDRDDFAKTYKRIDKLEKGEGTALNIRGFSALRAEGIRAGETRLATVMMNVSYHYATSSSLLTEIMSQEEINRRIQNKENVFRNVLATAKTSPAKLSLNVGPQPLIAGTPKVLLLASVSSGRDDGEVKLLSGAKIIITLPKTIGSSLKCDYGKLAETPEEGQKAGMDTWVYKVPKDVTILSSEFQSIYAFICSFDANNVDPVKSDLITAELPDYTFVLQREKTIAVTPSLGIIFKPLEKDCNVATGVAACNAIDLNGKKCWHELPDMPLTSSILTTFGNVCHSCESTVCDDFIVPGACNEQSKQCGLSCEWDSEASSNSVTQVSGRLRASNLDPVTGACKEKIVSGVTIGTCSGVPASFVSSYNRYKNEVATALSLYSLNNVQMPEALVAALISRESSWNERAYRYEARVGDASYGLMQIIPKFHPECDATKIKNYDVGENIKCGVRFLSNNIKECGNIEGALRKYNSGSCSGSTFDPNYVDQILNGDTTFKSSYSNWLACFQQGTARGDKDYCENKLQGKIPNVDAVACKEGEGGCKNDAECENIYTEPNPPQRLACRTTLNPGICCFPTDNDQACLQRFNQWKTT